jgi:hypothetical protein
MSFDSDVVPPDSSIVVTSAGSACTAERVSASAGVASSFDRECWPPAGSPTTKTARNAGAVCASSCAIAR